jgi:hypothetical protein
MITYDDEDNNGFDDYDYGFWYFSFGRSTFGLINWG